MILQTIIGSNNSGTGLFTFTYDQIIDANGTIASPGFNGSSCLLALTPEQASQINNGSYDGGYLAQWAPGSTHEDYGPYAVLFSDVPGTAILYGTPYGWPEPEIGQWNFPVTISFIQAF